MKDNMLNTIGVGKKIISPMAAFNNFLLNLGNEFERIFDFNLFEKNAVLFDDTSIYLFGKFKLQQYETDMSIELMEPIINYKDVRLMQKVLENYSELSSILFRYLFVMNNIRNNYDSSVNQKFVETVYDEVLKLYDNKTKSYFIPYKNKINKIIDNFNIEDSNVRSNIEKAFLHYTYSIKFIPNKRYIQLIDYQLIRVVSTPLDESKSIENIRPLENEIMLKGSVQKNQLYNFICNLMYYGEI